MDALRMTGVDIGHRSHRVLAGVDLRVAAGEVVIFRGRSGSGKTSLLSVAAGLLQPMAGHVHVAGKDMARRPAQTRRQHIGLVFQNLRLLPELTVRDNVELGLRLARRPPKERREVANRWMDRFGIYELAQRRPGNISGGEQQRAAIARAMVMDPALLLVDEPTSALDQETALYVVDALHAAAAEGTGVAVATHDDIVQGYREYLVKDGKVGEA